MTEEKKDTSRCIWMRVSEEMHEDLKARAKELALPTSSYARMLLKRGLDAHSNAVKKKEKQNAD